MKKGKNLFDLAMDWYRSKVIKRDEKERIKLREEYLQKTLERCKKLFHIGDLIQSSDETDSLPNLIISEPRIQKVEHLPFCVENSWEYGPDEKYTIVVDTVRIHMNEHLNRKSKVCLEELLYYMDKPKNDRFRKKGFIDLKEYVEKQVEKKNKRLRNLKEREQRVLKDLSELQKDIAILEEYNPNGLTSKKIKEILRDVTETH